MTEDELYKAIEEKKRQSRVQGKTLWGVPWGVVVALGTLTFGAGALGLLLGLLTRL